MQVTDFEIIPVNLQKKEQKTTEFLKMQVSCSPYFSKSSVRCQYFYIHWLALMVWGKCSSAVHFAFSAALLFDIVQRDSCAAFWSGPRIEGWRHHHVRWAIVPYTISTTTEPNILYNRRVLDKLGCLSNLMLLSISLLHMFFIACR